MLGQVSYELKFIIEKILTNVEAERLHDRKSWVVHKAHYKIDSPSPDYTLSGSVGLTKFLIGQRTVSV